jgi:hypothetical protein
MMNRGEFGGVLVGMAAIPTTTRNNLAEVQKPRKNTLMHVGGDYHCVVGDDIASKQNLEYNLRHGAKHITAEFRKPPKRSWDPDELNRIKSNCDRYGVVFEAIRMNSDYINKLRKWIRTGR